VLTCRGAAPKLAAPPRIGLCHTHLWDSAGADSRHAIDDAAKRLTAAGAKLRDIRLPERFKEMSVTRTVINPVERARALTWEYNTKPDLLSAGLRKQVEDGLAIPYARYVTALKLVKECQAELQHAFVGVDALLAPCVAGEAPEGLDWTGEPKFQEFWTALHVPTITLPTHLGPKGLPVGIQLVAPLYADETLLSVSRWVMDKLGRA
jgi:amidase